MVNNLRQYDLGENVDIEDFDADPFTVLDFVKLTFQTDGVDDKIYFTITSADTGEIVFYGRNAYVRTAPIKLLRTPIMAIDDTGVGGSMNIYINAKGWPKKNPIV